MIKNKILVFISVALFLISSTFASALITRTHIGEEVAPRVSVISSASEIKVDFNRIRSANVTLIGITKLSQNISLNRASINFSFDFVSPFEHDRIVCKDQFGFVTYNDTNGFYARLLTYEYPETDEFTDQLLITCNYNIFIPAEFIKQNTVVWGFFNQNTRRTEISKITYSLPEGEDIWESNIKPDSIIEENGRITVTFNNPEKVSKKYLAVWYGDKDDATFWISRVDTYISFIFQLLIFLVGLQIAYYQKRGRREFLKLFSNVGFLFFYLSAIMGTIIWTLKTNLFIGIFFHPNFFIINNIPQFIANDLFFLIAFNVVIFVVSPLIAIELSITSQEKPHYSYFWRTKTKLSALSDYICRGLCR